jgi:hypothetical protein
MKNETTVIYYAVIALEWLKELFCIHKYLPDEYRDVNGEWRDCLSCSKCFKMKRIK